MRPEWTHLQHTIDEGARWVRSGRQPKNAVITQFGRGNHAGGGLTVGFWPNGQRTRDPGPGTISWGPEPRSVDMHRTGTAVVCFEVRKTDDMGEFEKPSPFTAAEIDEFRAMLTAAGLPVLAEWNGAGCETGSFRVGKVAASLVRAQSNYLDGCPKHGHVFCGNRVSWGHTNADGTVRRDELTEQQLDELDCRWFADGSAAVVPPRWAAADWPEAPEQGPRESDDDRQLQEVRRVLALAHAKLPALGFHVGTIVAGHRGEIDDTDGELSYSDTTGHGITFTAEAAETVIEMLLHAFEDRSSR